MSVETTLRILIVLLFPSISFSQGTLTGSPITGDVPVSTLQSGTPERNVLVGTILASASVDDNNNNSAVHPITGTQYYLSPRLALQQSRSHLQFNVAYTPGIRFYVPSTSRPDQFSQLFGGTLHYDVNSRFAIGLRQDYLRTNDPFQQLGQTAFQPGIGLLNRPGTVIFPNFSNTMLLSEVNLDYQVAKHTSFGVNGEFMQIHHNHQRVGNNSLIETRDASGSSFLSHQFTARQAMGIQYQLLNIVFPNGNSRTTSQGVFLFDQITFRPHLSFSIFAGPQFSRIHNQELIDLSFVVIHVSVSKTLWSPAGGAMFMWEDGRTAFEASFVRRVADGTGLLGSIEMNDAALNIRRKLAHRWTGSLDGHMTEGTLLQVPGTGKLRILFVSPEISYELAQKAFLRLSYQHISRTGGYLSPLGFGNHNRVTLTVERTFTLPLGR